MIRLKFFKELHFPLVLFLAFVIALVMEAMVLKVLQLFTISETSSFLLN